MVSLDADDFILLCSITVKHAPAAIGFFFMMNQCVIIVNMVIDLEGQTPDMVADMLTGNVDIHTGERIEHDDRHEIK